MDVSDAIKNRRSVREFTDESISDQEIEKILDAGRHAPSGLNNQPWRFMVVVDSSLKSRLAECTHYGGIIRGSAACIVVFLDTNASYDRTKDVQAVGACIQNMLLKIHSLGLGGVWLGEILNQRKKVEKLLGAPTSYELMAVVASGYPIKKKRMSSRKDLSELIFRR